MGRLQQHTVEGLPKRHFAAAQQVEAFGVPRIVLQRPFDPGALLRAQLVIEVSHQLFIRNRWLQRQITHARSPVDALGTVFSSGPEPSANLRRALASAGNA